jgi:hypothetical protein
VNPKVLPASCRQRNQGEVLPTRRRQHLVGGTVRLVRGSWSHCTVRKTVQGSYSTNQSPAVVVHAPIDLFGTRANTLFTFPFRPPYLITS